MRSTRNRSGILLTLAQYISSTPCYVSKLPFGWTELSTERATDRGACIRASWANPEIEEWSGLNGSRPCKWFPSLPGETGTGKRRFAGNFRLDRSIPRSPGSGLQQRHSRVIRMHRHTGKYPRYLSIPPSCGIEAPRVYCIPSKAMG